MTDQRPDELRHLVHQLTNPHVVEITDAGRLIGTRTDPGLLTALRDAKTANIGAGNGRHAHHERLTLNVPAVELYTTLERHIRQWVLHTTWRPDTPHWPHPERLLQIWYSRTYQQDAATLAPYTATMRLWTRAIQDLLINPPRRWTIHAPCPVCKERWAITGTPEHQERVDALQVTERDHDHDHDITCRACGTQWHGLDSARELRDELTTRPIHVIHPEIPA